MVDKWKILITSSIIAFSAEFFQDIPSVLTRRLTGTSPSCDDGSDRCFQLSNMKYNAISTAYTFSSAPAAVIAAVIIRKYGNKGAVWTSSALMFIGSILFASGSHAEENVGYPIMIVGRVIFGLGNGASLTTSNHMINNAWNNEASPMGWYLLFAGLGSAVTFALNGGILNAVGMSGCLWIAAGLTTIAALAGVLLGFQDDGDEASTGHYANEKGLWNFLRNNDAIFWTFTLTYFFVHSVVSTYTNNGPGLLGMVHGHTEAQASYNIGVVHYLAVFIPLVGWLVDKTGRRDYWMTTGTIFLTAAFATYLGYWKFHNFGLSLFIGIGYTLFDPTASSSTSIISPKHTGGFANGVLKFFRYIGVGLFSLVAGAVLDQEKEEGDDSSSEWYQLIIILLSVSACAILSGLLLIYFNWKSKKQPLTPNKTERERKNSDDGIQEYTPLNVEFGTEKANSQSYDSLTR